MDSEKLIEAFAEEVRRNEDFTLEAGPSYIVRVELLRRLDSPAVRPPIPKCHCSYFEDRPSGRVRVFYEEADTWPCEHCGICQEKKRLREEVAARPATEEEPE